MKKREAIIATTHRDRHNERFTRGALEGMVFQINNRYIPMGIEHDPRIPPQGRIVSAKLEQLSDGEYGVVGQVEIFQFSFDVPFENSDRKMPVRSFDDAGIYLLYDRTYRNEEDQAKLNELSILVSGHLQEEHKKALEPLSVLTLAGMFIAGAFFSGFFNQFGADVYEKFKYELKKLIAKKRKSVDETLFVFQAIIKRNDYFISVETIVTNPNDSDIDFLLLQGLNQLDKIVPPLIESSHDMSRFVFECSNGKIKLKFGVRNDAVPMYPVLSQDDN